MPVSFPSLRSGSITERIPWYSALVFEVIPDRQWRFLVPHRSLRAKDGGKLGPECKAIDPSPHILSRLRCSKATAAAITLRVVSWFVIAPRPSLTGRISPKHHHIGIHAYACVCASNTHAVHVTTEECTGDTSKPVVLGADVVAYRSLRAGQPAVMGSDSLSVVYGRYLFYFSTLENQQKFEVNYAHVLLSLCGCVRGGWGVGRGRLLLQY